MFPYSIKKRILKFIKCEFYIVDEFDNVFVSKDEFQYMVLPKSIYKKRDYDKFEDIEWYGYDDDEIKKLSDNKYINKIYYYKKRYIINQHLRNNNNNKNYKLKTDYIDIVNILHHDMPDYPNYYIKNSFKELYDNLAVICETFSKNRSCGIDNTLNILSIFIKENIYDIEKILGVNFIDFIEFNEQLYVNLNDDDILNYYIKYFVNDNNLKIDDCLIKFKNKNQMILYYRNKLAHRIVNLFDNYDLLKINDEQLNDNDIMYIENGKVEIKKNIEYNNNKIKIISKDIFNERLDKYTNGLFECITEEEWDYIIFSGGGLFNILNNCERICDDVIQNSDIDLFFHRGDVDCQMDITNDILKRIKNKYGDIKVFRSVKYNNYIEIYIPNMRKIQFIYKLGCSSTIQHFDIECYKVYYNGKDVYCNIECLCSYKYWYCVENIDSYDKKENEKKYYNYINRIVKTMKKGMGIKFVSGDNVNNLKIIMDNFKIKYSNHEMIDITDTDLNGIINYKTSNYFDIGDVIVDE